MELVASVASVVRSLLMDGLFDEAVDKAFDIAAEALDLACLGGKVQENLFFFTTSISSIYLTKYVSKYFF